jgi:hypothetical protein
MACSTNFEFKLNGYPPFPTVLPSADKNLDQNLNLNYN